MASCASKAVKVQEEVKKKSEYVERIEMEADLMLKVTYHLFSHKVR